MPLYLTNPFDGSRWAVVPVKATDKMMDHHYESGCDGGGDQDQWMAACEAVPEFPVEAMVEKVRDVLKDELSISVHPSPAGFNLMYAEVSDATARAVLAALFEVKP
jgi:hypothetical protein